MGRVKKVVEDAAEIQAEWYKKTDPRRAPATGEFNFIAMMSMMGQFGMGASLWLQQFVWGFALTGDLSQSGVYPTDPQVLSAPDLSSIWDGAESRYRARANGTGWPNAEILWSVALEQVEKGWLMDPHPIGGDGQCPNAAIGPINVSFRFGVGQMGNLRACDDLKYGPANLYCSVWAPIKLPTWDHIAQLAARARKTKCAWPFFKADHESAYKQLPLDPNEQNLPVVTLRHPVTGIWHAFVPRALLFGAVAAVLHYNCFSRAVAVLFTKLAGIPLLSYFDDFGALVPSEVLGHALGAFTKFCSLPGIRPKSEITEKGPALTFLGVFA